jgi:sugar phosphate isomerase/epimerase
VVLGISSYSFPWAVNNKPNRHAVTASGLISYAASKKLKAVQFGDNLPLHLLSRKELIQLRSSALTAGISLETGTRHLSLLHIRKYIKIATLLSSRFIRVVIDDAGYEPDEAQVISIIRKLLPELKEANLMLAIENHDRFSSNSLLRIVEQTDPELVGICLDSANSLGAGEGIHEVVNSLARYTVNLHIKDFRITRVDHKMGFLLEGCAAGHGILDIPWLVEEMNQYPRCRTATLEVWSNPDETNAATLNREKEWVEQSVSYLKTIIHE